MPALLETAVAATAAAVRVEVEAAKLRGSGEGAASDDGCGCDGGTTAVMEDAVITAEGGGAAVSSKVVSRKMVGCDGVAAATKRARRASTLGSVARS